jgi:hypothetical protein
MTPTQPTAKKKAPKAKSAAAPEVGKNLARLRQAKVIPASYSDFTPVEKKAIESLSAGEVNAIISTKTKLGRKFFAKTAATGMYF